MELETFRGVVHFVAVAEERSFRRAAARLQVTPAAVSKAVAALEAELGQALFVRTTRAVSLTAQGEQFFARCQQAVAAVHGAKEAVSSSRGAPTGTLTISLPFIAAPLLPPALSLLSSRYPALRFDVRVTDQLSRFAQEAIDVAVRIGFLQDSTLIAKRLRSTKLVTIASPAYVARHGAPQTAAQLSAHRCLVARAPNNKPRPFVLASGPVEVNGALVVDHGPTLVSAALAGLGVTQAFDFMVDGLVREGRLVPLLGELTAAGPDVFAVCAPGRRASANVRVAFDALAEAFARTS